VAGDKTRGTKPPRTRPGAAIGGDPVRATGGGHSGTGSRGTPERPPLTAKEKRLLDIRSRVVGAEAVEDAARRAKLTEWLDIENWIPELRREGFTDFYASRISQGPNAGELPRGAVEFGHDDFGKILKRVYHSGGRTGGPDLVAVDHARRRILVGDITAGEWSRATVPLKPGELHRQPAEIRSEFENPHHLVKTQRDAKELASGLPERFADYEVHFQDRYSESVTKASGRFQVPKNVRPGTTPSHPTDVERGLKQAAHPRGEVHLPKARLVRGAERDVERLAEHGLKFKALVMGAKAWRATRRIGAVALLMFIPMTPLDFAFEIAMALWDLHREKEEREQRRKERALAAVLNDPKFDVAGLIAARVTASAGYDALLTLWDTNPGQSGFVYARINAVLEVELFRDTRNEEVEDATRYTPVAVEVSPLYVDYPFELAEIGDEEDVDLTDADRARMLTTTGLLVRKRKQRLRLKYTVLPPAITPFDVVLTKVNNLFLDLLYFVAQFENLGEPILAGITRFDYSGSYQDMIGFELQYPAPLRRATCEYCLDYLHWAGKMLSSHPLAEVDLEGTFENPMRGWRRRHAILVSLLEGRDTRYRKNFAYFAAQMTELVGSSPDPEVNAAVTELYTGAGVVLSDLRRLYRNEKSPEYFYYGPDYEPQK
jgi:hypothetical protein